MKEGRNYWLIPFLFAIIYIETGFILQSYEGIFVFLINGQPSLAVPNNYLAFYNTAHGPFSSIFLSNFIFDGFGNLIAFQILLVASPDLAPSFTVPYP